MTVQDLQQVGMRFAKEIRLAQPLRFPAPVLHAHLDLSHRSSRARCSSQLSLPMHTRSSRGTSGSSGNLAADRSHLLAPDQAFMVPVAAPGRMQPHTCCRELLRKLAGDAKS